MAVFQPFDDDDDHVPFQIPDEFRRMAVEEEKWKVRELWDRYQHGNIVLEPDFQRHYVWDDARASRYIESLILNLPTPPIFVSEESDGRWLVVDGHQRTETIFRFMQPLLRRPSDVQDLVRPPTAIRPLTLRSMEVLTDLNGKGVTAFSIDDRSDLWDSEIPVIILKRTNSPDLKYVLFARLNLGSMALNNQELRNCLYRGPFNRLLDQLSNDRRFLSLWRKNEPDKRMVDRERVLRFFALLHRMDRYRTPFRAFLNDEMESNQQLDLYSLERCQREFHLALLWTERVFGEEAFKRFRIEGPEYPSGRWINRRHDLIYECETVGFGSYSDRLDEVWNELDEQQKELFKACLRRRLAGVMSEERFADTLNEQTTAPRVVRVRFDMWNETLESVVSNPQAEIGRFQEIRRLWSDSNICARCPRPIDSIDDAVVVEAEKALRVSCRYCARRA